MVPKSTVIGLVAWWSDGKAYWSGFSVTIVVVVGCCQGMRLYDGEDARVSRGGVLLVPYWTELC